MRTSCCFTLFWQVLDNLFKKIEITITNYVYLSIQLSFPMLTIICNDEFAVNFLVIP